MKTAVFDVDGTLLKHSCERIFIKFLLKRGALSPLHLALAIPDIIKQFPEISLKTIKSFRGYYRGMDYNKLDKLAGECFESKIKNQISQKMIRIIANHRNKGHKIVILTGASDMLAKRIQDYTKGDYLIATKLHKKNGLVSGTTEGRPVYGENKLLLLKQRQEGIDFGHSYCYADSFSDIKLLKAFGHPTATNPDILLRSYALLKKWKIIRL